MVSWNGAMMAENLVAARLDPKQTPYSQTAHTHPLFAFAAVIHEHATQAVSSSSYHGTKALPSA